MLFNILANVSEVAKDVTPANWGMSCNRIGMTISATWLIAWPAIITVGILAFLSYKYISLRRQVGVSNSSR
jgi:hypothetical protein